jgi:outer membrane protein
MKKKLLLLTLACAAAPAFAADLLQVYRDALDFDAQYASARAARDAGQEKLPQGRAGRLRPAQPGTMSITGGAFQARRR